MNRRIIFQLFSSLALAYPLFLFFTPRYSEVLDKNHIDYNLATMLTISAIDVVLIYFVLHRILDFAKALLASKSHDRMKETFIYATALSCGLIFCYIVRFMYSYAEAMTMQGVNALGYTAFCTLFSLISIFLVTLITSFSMQIGFELMAWILLEEENVSITTHTPKEPLHTPDDIEKEHDITQIEHRLKKATELYNTVQTEEGRAKAKVMIDEMTATIDRFHERLSIEHDESILSEIEKQKRVNEESIHA